MKLKKIISLLLILIFSTINVSAAQIQLGEIDDDGTITAKDAALALTYARNTDSIPSSLKFTAADIDSDAMITASDAARILLAARGTITLPTVNVEDESQSQSVTEKPVETTTEYPTETSTETPAQSTTEAPIESTTETSTETTTEVSTETTTAEIELGLGSSNSGESGISVVYDEANDTWTLKDTSGSLAAQLTIPFEPINSGIVTFSGTAKPSTSAGKWAFVQLHGITSDETVKEIISIASDSDKNLSARINGATYTSFGEKLEGNKEYNFNIILDIDNKTATVTINGTTKTISDIDVSEVNSIFGITAVSASRTVWLSNLSIKKGSFAQEEVPTETTTENPTETTTDKPVESTTQTPTETTSEKPTESTTSAPPSPTSSAYSITGFGKSTTGGGSIDESNSKYIKVSNAEEFGKAIKGSYSVIEITADIDLGYNVLSSGAKNTGIFSEHSDPLSHPLLKQTGVSRVKLSSKSNMTIFSKNGARLTHAGFDLSSCKNVIIRNLEFDELWEWDEKTKGDYDKNDWDYMTLQGCSNIWIDHCTFGKAYDGIVDLKKGSNNVTISWCNFPAADTSEGSFLMQQFDELENNMSSNAFYKYLRENVGLTKEEIAKASAGQKKTHLVGSSEFGDGNEDLSITLAYNYYDDSHDRMPRLRAGNAHVFNTVMNSSDNRKINNAIEARLEAKASEMSSKGYHFGITSNGALSTEDGAVLVENCVMIGIARPLANDQKKNGNAAYVGKIKAEHIYYELDDTVYVNIGSDDENTPLVPDGSDTIKEFSWNGFTTLPYTYTVIHPLNVENELYRKVGAGAININWLATRY